MNTLAVLDNTDQKTSRSAIRAGKLVVNLDTRIVSVDNRAVHLSGKEYSLLELLSRHKGTVVTKEMLLVHLYGGIKEPELKIIDVFVCHLRKKLARATGGNHYIETVWGRGYVLRDTIPPVGRPQPARHEVCSRSQVSGLGCRRLLPPTMRPDKSRLATASPQM
jgi:DNA-binding winged helix-turn-helix (wHTH) protein